MVEKFEVVIGTNGQVERADIVGKLQAECLLTEPATFELHTNVVETGANLK